MDSPFVRYGTTAETLATPAYAEPTLTWDWTWLREICEILIPSILISAFLLTFVVQPTRVQGISMQPTLYTGQRLVLEKVSYSFAEPQIGDVVVLQRETDETSALIKRVIATSGDTVEIRDGVVYRNGESLPTTLYNDYTPGNLRLTEIPMGHIFVLGDNRSHSSDSRAFGTIPESDIVGHAVFSYWPLNTLGFVQ